DKQQIYRVVPQKCKRLQRIRLDRQHLQKRKLRQQAMQDHNTSWLIIYHQQRVNRLSHILFISIVKKNFSPSCCTVIDMGRSSTLICFSTISIPLPVLTIDSTLPSSM